MATGAVMEFSSGLEFADANSFLEPKVLTPHNVKAEDQRKLTPLVFYLIRAEGF